MWVTAWCLGFVDKLLLEKSTHKSAAEDRSYLQLVIGSDNLYPSGSALHVKLDKKL